MGERVVLEGNAVELADEDDTARVGWATGAPDAASTTADFVDGWKRLGKAFLDAAAATREALTPEPWRGWSDGDVRAALDRAHAENAVLQEHERIAGDAALAHYNESVAPLLAESLRRHPPTVDFDRHDDWVDQSISMDAALAKGHAPAQPFRAGETAYTCPCGEPLVTAWEDGQQETKRVCTGCDTTLLVRRDLPDGRPRVAAWSQIAMHRNFRERVLAALPGCCVVGYEADDGSLVGECTWQRATLTWTLRRNAPALFSTSNTTAFVPTLDEGIRVLRGEARSAQSAMPASPRVFCADDKADRECNVFLDGVQQDHVYRACPDEGWIEVYDLADDGKPIPGEPGCGMRMKRLTGQVTVVHLEEARDRLREALGPLGKYALPRGEAR